MGWTGFRLPNHSIPIAVAATFGSSIALTSANLSGDRDPRTADETNHLAADLTLDSGPTADQAIPSTVIKIHSHHLEISVKEPSASPRSRPSLTTGWLHEKYSFYLHR